MSIQGAQPAAVIQDHSLPVTAHSGTRDNPAGPDCPDLLAALAPDVDASVTISSTVYSEAGKNLSARDRPRPISAACARNQNPLIHR